MEIKELKAHFAKYYGEKEGQIRVFFSPARINLMGEYLDCNGGAALPCAINLGTYLAVRKSSNKSIGLASSNFKYSAVIPLADIHQKISQEWVNYPLGVLNQMVARGMEACGLEFFFSGDIPIGAGLSSSASIQMVTAFALNEMFEMNLDRIELAKLCKKSESEFCGINSSMMDHFAVAMAKESQAVVMDYETLKYEHVPLKLGDYRMVVANSGKTTELVNPKYIERKGECEKVVNVLNKKHSFQLLGKLPYPVFSQLIETIPNETLRCRAHYVVGEVERVKLAVTALREGKLALFGELMDSSHDSLSDDFGVSTNEIDILTEEARKIKGVLDTRMTGAGLGGCVVSLVYKDAVETFKKKVGENYMRQTGLNATFFVVEAVNGVCEIK
jgi:galactokinase